MLQTAKTISIIILVTLLLLLFKKPVEWALNYYTDYTLHNHFLAGIISRLPIIALAIYLMRRFGFQRINGFYPQGLRLRNLQALIIPFGIVIAAGYSKYEVYRAAEPGLLALFALSVLVIGIAEECLFRGVILPLIVRSRAEKKDAVLIAVLLSSLLFGLIHYFNLISQPHNFSGVTSQVIFAFSLGVVFAGLFIRVENILPIALFHGVLNFAFGSGQLREAAEKAPADYSPDTGSLIAGLVLYGIIIAAGIVMTQLSNRQHIVDKVRSNA